MQRRLIAALLLVLPVVAACTEAAPTTSTGTLTLTLRAGPVCPVEQNPPNPACAPCAVSGAQVVILDGDREVARGSSNADGRIDFSLPSGRYRVHPISNGGFPTPPEDLVVDIGALPVELDLDYDTGIR